MSNDKQQTAVEILCGKLANKLGIPQAITFYVDHEQEILEALEMEKEQIEQAFEIGTDCVYDLNVPQSAQDYYEQKYGGNK